MKSTVLRPHYWPPVVMLLLVLTASFAGANDPGMLSGHNLLVWSCVIIWAAILWCYRGEPAPCRGLILGVLAVVLLMSLPLLWTTQPAWRLNALPRLVGLWAGAGLVLLLLRTRFGIRGRALLVTTLVIAGVIQALMALTQLLFPLSPFVRFVLHYDVLAAQGRVLGSLGQVNLLGSFLAASAGAALWCLLSIPVRQRGIRLCGWISLGLILTALVVTRSRTGWLGGLISCAGVAWLARGQRPWQAMAGCAFASLVLAVSVIHLQPQVRVTTPAPSVAAPAEDTFSLDRMRHESWDRRLQMLRVSAALIKQHPLAGSGLGSFERRWSDGLTALGEVSATPERVIYPHNELLYVWVEGGAAALVGLLLAGMLWLLPLIKSLFNRKRCTSHNERERRYIGLWPLSLPLALHAMTEFPFYLSALHFVLFLLLWRLALPDGRRCEGVARKAWLALPAGLAGFVMLVACAVNLIQLREVEKSGFSSPITLFLPEVSQLMQADRLQFDRCVSLLIAYNQSRDIRLLQTFVAGAEDYLAAHNDPNLMDSLIRVDKALGLPDRAEQIRHRSRVSFPDDPRFFNGAHP